MYPFNFEICCAYNLLAVDGSQETHAGAGSSAVDQAACDAATTVAEGQMCYGAHCTTHGSDALYQAQMVKCSRFM